MRRRPVQRALSPAERAEVRAHVMRRDACCVIHQLALEGRIEGATPCRSVQDGRLLDPYADREMTEEHVKSEPGMSVRGEDDPRWAVKACAWHNSTTVETSKYRPQIREHLARMAAAGAL